MVKDIDKLSHYLSKNVYGQLNLEMRYNMLKDIMSVFRLTNITSH